MTDDKSTPIPTNVLVVFALVLTPLGFILATTCGSSAWIDARKIEAPGVVVEARVVETVKPPARAHGHWLKERLIEFDAPDGPHRKWFWAGWYRDKEEAAPHRDNGLVVPVWYSPGNVDEAVVDPPQALSKLLWTCWSTVMGSAGLISIYALFRRLTGRLFERSQQQ